MYDQIMIRLFVTGQTSRSRLAIRNVVRSCRNDVDLESRLSIIDVLERPEIAEHARVFATPTLVVESVDRDRRLIGDLADIRTITDWLTDHVDRNDDVVTEDRRQTTTNAIRS